MNKKQISILIPIIFIITVLGLFFFGPNTKLHSINKYGDISEHLDINFQWPRFKINHSLMEKSKGIVFSEGLRGIYYRNIFTGSYNLIPISQSNNVSEQIKNASLSLQTPLTICIYTHKEQSVLFMDDYRGGINIDGNNINLSSLFLGEKNTHN